MSSEKKLPGWRSIPSAGMVLKPGNFAERPTGDWRIFKPIINQDKCLRCLICWAICPEPAINIVDKPYRTATGKEWKFTLEVNYNYCKGCGLCVEECPVKAINFVEEVK
ncbi:MAG: 4Fe-4S binding protein [Ignisphaera sp.]|uniref:4Fe-4S dicluster domain-containing protein n=1 Tax=Ignisphaera aggregans TaxID=334771 RepID=A0A7C4JJR1_9CREN